MNRELLNYQYLWDSTAPQWGLIKEENINGLFYFVVNVQTKMALLIENDELKQQIIDKMLSANVKIYSLGDWTEISNRH